ncbi:hypothetical protein PFISCL1PPCAC_18061, partial [Pristionchus fissidentatus]
CGYFHSTKELSNPQILGVCINRSDGGYRNRFFRKIRAKDLTVFSTLTDERDPLCIWFLKMMLDRCIIKKLIINLRPRDLIPSVQLFLREYNEPMELRLQQISLSHKEFLSFERPVAFSNICLKQYSSEGIKIIGVEILRDGLFLALMEKGHSLYGYTLNCKESDTISKAVTIITGSESKQCVWVHLSNGCAIDMDFITKLRETICESRVLDGNGKLWNGVSWNQGYEGNIYTSFSMVIHSRHCKCDESFLLM